MLFGDRLKLLREDKGITQKELGAIVGVSDRVIGYYESNDRFPKDEYTLKKIADYFDVSADSLLGRINEDNLYNPRDKAKEILEVFIRAGKNLDDIDFEKLENYLRFGNIEKEK